MPRAYWLLLAGVGAVIGLQAVRRKRRKRTAPLGRSRKRHPPQSPKRQIRRGPRTGTIEIDPAVVEARVEEILAKFEGCPEPNPTKWSKHDFLTPKAVVLPPTPIRDPATGVTRPVRIAVIPRKTKPNEYGHISAKATGSAQSDVTADGELMDQLIYVKPSLAACAAPETWRQELRRVLTHELTHTADPYILKRNQKKSEALRAKLQADPYFLKRNQNRAEPLPDQHGSAIEPTKGYRPWRWRRRWYHNSAVEMAAQLAEVEGELRADKQARLWSDDELAPNKLLTWTSGRYQELEPWLSPENKRRFFQLAARLQEERRAADVAEAFTRTRKRFRKHLRKARKRIPDDHHP